MKKTNVIIKNANLNILKAVVNTLTTVEKEYLGYQAPCVVFEDVNGVVYFVAKTKEEYFKNINLVAPTLAENQATKLAKLNEYINTKKKAFEAPYSQVSIESFNQKKNEALAWKIDNLAVTPYIDMLCTDSTGTLNTTARDTLIQAILVKVQGIAQLEAFEDATRTAIKATTTQAELDTVVIP